MKDLFIIQGRHPSFCVPKVSRLAHWLTFTKGTACIFSVSVKGPFSYLGRRLTDLGNIVTVWPADTTFRGNYQPFKPSKIDLSLPCRIHIASGVQGEKVTFIEDGCYNYYITPIDLLFKSFSKSITYRNCLLVYFPRVEASLALNIIFEYLVCLCKYSDCLHVI